MNAEGKHVSDIAAQLRAAGVDWIVPDWDAPAGVQAFFTTRNGGGGEAASLDLGPGDAPVESHIYGVAAHLVFGIVLEGTRRLIAGRR